MAYIASMHIIAWKADHACFKSNSGQTNDLIVISAYCINISATPKYWFVVSGPPTKIVFTQNKFIVVCNKNNVFGYACTNVCLVLLQKYGLRPVKLCWDQ